MGDVNMSSILIRKATEPDIPAVSKLAIELINSVKNDEFIAEDVLL